MVINFPWRQNICASEAEAGHGSKGTDDITGITGTAALRPFKTE